MDKTLKAKATKEKKWECIKLKTLLCSKGNNYQSATCGMGENIYRTSDRGLIFKTYRIHTAQQQKQNKAK